MNRIQDLLTLPFPPIHHALEVTVEHWDEFEAITEAARRLILRLLC